MLKLRILLSALNKGLRNFKKTDKSMSWLVCDTYALCLNHHVGTNTYVSEHLWNVLGNERERWLESYGIAYQQRCERERKKKEYLDQRNLWIKRYLENRKFLLKYSSMKWDCSIKQMVKRNEAYRLQYNMGKGCTVQYGVELNREHYLNGTIEIGNNVLFAKHVFIDYSGEVVIKDNVQLANGVIIENHFHKFHSDWKQQDKYLVEPSCLTIEHDAMLGSKAIIMPSCHYIGIHSRVGAGAVVTHDVPDYAVVAGVPARVIKIMEH